MLTLFLRSGLPLPRKNHLQPNPILALPEIPQAIGRLHFELVVPTSFTCLSKASRPFLRFHFVQSVNRSQSAHVCRNSQFCHFTENIQ